MASFCSAVLHAVGICHFEIKLYLRMPKETFGNLKLLKDNDELVAISSLFSFFTIH